MLSKNLYCHFFVSIIPIQNTCLNPILYISEMQTLLKVQLEFMNYVVFFYQLVCSMESYRCKRNAHWKSRFALTNIYWLRFSVFVYFKSYSYASKFEKITMYFATIISASFLHKLCVFFMSINNLISMKYFTFLTKIFTLFIDLIPFFFVFYWPLPSSLYFIQLQKSLGNNV